MKKDGILYTVIFTFIVTFFFVFFLSLANEGTKERVASNIESARRKAVLTAMDIGFTSADEAAKIYESVKTEEKDGVKVYSYSKDGRTVYAKEFTGNGLWGIITGVLGVNAEVTETEGIEIISHNETPGLGGRIDEDAFKSQFRGEKIVNGTVVVTYGAETGGAKADPNDGIVDGITGASRTSQSMSIILQKEISTFKKILGVN